MCLFGTRPNGPANLLSLGCSREEGRGLKGDRLCGILGRSSSRRLGTACGLSWVRVKVQVLIGQSYSLEFDGQSN